jgi:hypothetical protein
MTSVCVTCGGDFSELKNTWSPRSSLTRGTWYPNLSNEKEKKEGYCSSCSSGGTRSDWSWTSGGNVSPQNALWKQVAVNSSNSQINKKLSGISNVSSQNSASFGGECREGYSVSKNMGSYSLLKSTWAMHGLYKLG